MKKKIITIVIIVAIITLGYICYLKYIKQPNEINVQQFNNIEQQRKLIDTAIHNPIIGHRDTLQSIQNKPLSVIDKGIIVSKSYQNLDVQINELLTKINTGSNNVAVRDSLSRYLNKVESIRNIIPASCLSSTLISDKDLDKKILSKLNNASGNKEVSSTLNQIRINFKEDKDKLLDCILHSQ